MRPYATEEVNVTQAERSGAANPLRYLLVAVGVALGFSTIVCGVLTLVL
jgi:hypothetical protein